jgi:hypothetical protein
MSATKERDKEALTRALEIFSRDPRNATQVKGKMAQGDSWAECAGHAAYNCQIKALGLLPWQNPPCHCDGTGTDLMDRLLRRMLDAGLSAYEPDPLAALKG